MLFLKNEPAKKAEINILTAQDTTPPGYYARAPWVAIPGVYKAVYIMCTSSRLTNQPLFGFP